MNGKKSVVIESIKNILIAVLFALAIFLLYFFLNNKDIYDIQNFIDLSDMFNYEAQEYQPELNALTLPSAVAVNYGEKYSYQYNSVSPVTKLPDSVTADNADNITFNEKNITIYSYMLGLMSAVMDSSPAVTAADSSDMDAAMREASLTAFYSYDIPFNQFVVSNSMKVPSSISAIGYVNTFCFSIYDEGAIYVKDSINNAFYRLTPGDGKYSYSSSDIMRAADYLHEASDGYTIMSDIAEGAGNIMVPAVYTGGRILCKAEFSLSSERDIADIEKQFFGTGMDFVRKITENKGTRLYIYGQSQKVLFIKDDGSINYKEEMDADRYHENSFYDALNRADVFITSHGGWEVMLECGMTPYITGLAVTSTGDGKRGYIFEFGMIYENMPVAYEDGCVISVEIYGDQVTSYTRNVIAAAVQSGSWTYTVSKDMKDAKDVFEIINENELIICGALYDKGLETADTRMQELYSPDNSVHELLQNIKNINICLLMKDRASADGIYLIPVWNIEIEGCYFMFDTQGRAV